MSDRQRAKTYAAEWTWRGREKERKTITSIEQVHVLLARILPPVTMAKVSLRPLNPSNHADGGWVDYRGHGRWVLSMRIPTYPSMVVHEAAHILTHVTDGYDGHGQEFRRTLIWLLRQTHGLRRAVRLGRAFEEEGLKW